MTRKRIAEPFGVILADPPWQFGDALTMQSVPRGASSNYPVLTLEAIALLPIVTVAADDCLLALWCPGSMLADGLLVMRHWGFRQKQVVPWVKTTKDGKRYGFGMGRQFRGCSELCLIGTRGKPRPAVRNERGIVQHPALPHSAKPEHLHHALARMYPDARRLELFARRDVEGWCCVGNECPSNRRDVREWIPAEAKRIGRS